jgi:hypothetical protein
VGENLKSVAKNDDAEMQAQVEANTNMLYFCVIFVFAFVVCPGIIFVLRFYPANVRGNRGGGAGAGVDVRPGAGAGGNGNLNAFGMSFDDAGKLTTPGGMVVKFTDNSINSYLRWSHWDNRAKCLERLRCLKQKGEEVEALLRANGGHASIMELVCLNKGAFVKAIKESYPGCKYVKEDNMLLKYAILYAARIEVPRLVG